MSLINDALKKAQRQRNEEAAGAAGSTGAARNAKGRPASGSNFIYLVGAGALALIGLSVGVTVFLLNRPSTPPPAPIVAKTETPAAIEPPASSPIVSLPALTLPPASAATSIVNEPTAPATNPISASPHSMPAAVEPNDATPASPPSPAVATTPAVTSATPAPAPIVEPVETPAAEPPAPAKPDAGIYQYVDALRITGVKAAGADSRVLMNDRVYRVNDIVERNLGLRLIKVEANVLTFSDAEGAMYVKNF